MAKPRKVSGLYASGIATPFQGDSDGGVALTEGDTYIDEQVLAVVRPNDSDNPFQDLGITEYAVFKNPSDPSWRRVVRDRVVRQFRYLEENNLARLLRVKFAREDAENGDFFMTVEYVNLETNDQRESTFQLTGSEDVGLKVIR